MRKLSTALLAATVLSSAACNANDALNVEYKDRPDVERALKTPASIEELIAGTYKQIHTGLYGSSTAMTPTLMVYALETYGTVANFGMNARASIPRGAIANTRNYLTASENFRDFNQMERRARDAATGVIALDALIAAGGTLEQKGTTPTGKDVRARAFAFFSNGVALGNLALVYDSAAVVTPATPVPTVIEDVPPLSHYTAVMDTALMLLDTALALTAQGNFGTLDATWIPSTTTLSAANFTRLIRSYKARFRVGVARTPQDRAAVDWNAVIADATAGIQQDFVINMQTGWPLAFQGAQIFQDNSRGWHMMSMMYFGMADTSGAYQNWLSTPMTSRVPFNVITADQRWPFGNDRATQQRLEPGPYAYNRFPYIRNRTGQDTPGDPFGSSYYDFYRFKNIQLANGVGPWVAMSKVEIDMLAAEGHLRSNTPAGLQAAASLIDVSRLRAQLPPLSGNVASVNDPVPGATYEKIFRYDTTVVQGVTRVDTVWVGNRRLTTVPGASNCVPRVPVGPNFTTTACGNIWEALKWEKRMETAMTGYGQWYFDSRGWGDLVETTPLMFPVPYQEMDARNQSFYSMGGVGNPNIAPRGTYGF